MCQEVKARCRGMDHECYDLKDHWFLLGRGENIPSRYVKELSERIGICIVRRMMSKATGHQRCWHPGHHLACETVRLGCSLHLRYYSQAISHQYRYGGTYRSACLELWPHQTHLWIFHPEKNQPDEAEDRNNHRTATQDMTSVFFNRGLEEAGLDPSRVGVDKLRCFLEEILDTHIQRELPKVRDDIRRLFWEKNEELGRLRAERNSPNQIRMYLIKIATNYYNVFQAGIDVSYSSRDASFFEIRDERLSAWLCAIIHMENERFSDDIRQDGENRKIVSSTTHCDWGSNSS